MSSLKAKKRSGRVVGTLVITTCVLLGIVWLLGHLLLAFNPNGEGTVVADLQTASYQPVRQSDSPEKASDRELANPSSLPSADSTDAEAETEEFGIEQFDETPGQDEETAQEYVPHARDDSAAGTHSGFSDDLNVATSEGDDSFANLPVTKQPDDSFGEPNSQFGTEERPTTVDVERPAAAFDVPKLLEEADKPLSSSVHPGTNGLEKTVRGEIAEPIADNAISTEATSVLPAVEKPVADTRIEPTTVNRITPKYEPNTFDRSRQAAKRTQRVYPVRTWTSDDYKQVEARLVSHERDSVILSVNGKLYRVPLTRFSQLDLDYLKDLKNDTQDPVNN